jgi:hypothetical protein
MTTISPAPPIEQTNPSRRATLQAWLRGLCADPPEIVDTPQPSLRELIAYSKEGEWTTATDGAARFLHGAYTWVVAIPAATAAYVLAWVVRRPARVAVAVPLLFAIGTVAARVPVLGWFVPDLVDLTSWF